MVSPPERTGEVLDLLKSEPGATHLIPLRGAAVEPAGDLGEATGLLDVNAVRNGHNVDFVYQVGVFSLIVALLAGAAGMLSMTSAKSAALVGVFISVTTIPAAGYAAVAAVLGEWDRCLFSIGQLVVNLVGIVLAAAVVLLLRRRTWTARDNGRPLSTG
ncbi:large-conductance mechanosensitive channel [Kibdelosporangium banguiense]|uniref:Large-conductance mechanosensitive channel n=1 Tax=Kibdelosporangium banguiense TaxID=1365924 RepID=A0ABS4U0N1_9PSEU|nr:large-conductance mechanosensitive channel [Kibdelosporangium banguiense]